MVNRPLQLPLCDQVCNISLGICAAIDRETSAPLPRGQASWRKITARLGASNYPGDTMTMSGVVTNADTATGAVIVAYRGMNSLGPHITGTVELVLPV